MGDDSQRGLFDELWAVVGGKFDPNSAVDEVFDGTYADLLESGFRAYLERSRADRAGLVLR